jgi:starch-binding outer membrane protein, SusD/RagB family
MKRSLHKIVYYPQLLIACGLLVSVIFCSCKKFVSVPPPASQLVSSSVFENDATANAAVAGIYSQMMQSNGFISGTSGSILALTGLYSDELNLYTPIPDLNEFYSNKLIPSNGSLYAGIWREAYQYIYEANAVIEGLQSGQVSASMKKQLTGESAFIRALCYYDLLRLFNDVPLILHTDYQVNAHAVRTPAAEVYLQIIADLLQAQANLGSDYSFSNGERIRPNQGAATALLARVYLVTGDWTNAELQSASLLNNGLYSLLPDLNQVFLANSAEAIWQLAPVLPGYNTNEGSLFILTDIPYYYALSNSLLNAFETNDQRRTNWVDSLVQGAVVYYYPAKYKIRSGTPVTEYSMELRLAEQFLIRAEARTALNNLTGAADDLNTIRARAGLQATTASDSTSLMTAILHERQVEFFTEGHRWFDLQRSADLDLQMAGISAEKGANWVPTARWFPIPQSDIQTDPNLTQNPGY